jgi:predicted Zn-dependent protease with MMP-like domain
VRRSTSGPPPLLHRVGAAVVITVLAIGLTTLVAGGFASDSLLRFLQGASLFGLGTLVVLLTVSLVAVRLGGWRDPDAEFDALVERSEFLARSGADIEGHAYGFAAQAAARRVDLAAAEYQDLDVAAEDEEFDALVRAAIEELPLEFHRALEHVAIIVSDSGAVAIRGRDGRRRGAYGMYQGDTVAHDFFTERILIFRDTLLRDFGHDPELLALQVRRVLRHELAHHLGWGERGVRNLGL